MQNREHKRQETYLAIWICWEDDKGIPRRAIARCRNLSQSGTRVELYASFEMGEEVTVGIPCMGLTFKAVVRWCRPIGSKYSLGLEFQQRLAESKQGLSGPAVAEAGKHFAQGKNI